MRAATLNPGNAELHYLVATAAWALADFDAAWNQAIAARQAGYPQAPIDELIRDLADRGMLEHTLVIAMSEFGRTPRINGHAGRDHWPEAWSMAMAGTGLQPSVVGATDAEGVFVDGHGYDIGHVFHTWYRALGIDPDETEFENGDQPLPIAHDEMAAIEEALA